jgi:hypothetical protein
MTARLILLFAALGLLHAGITFGSKQSEEGLVTPEKTTRAHKTAKASRKTNPTDPTHFGGRFLGFVTTDYQVAVFCVRGDSTRWTYVKNTSAALFVAAHAGTELEITVEAGSEDTLDTGQIVPEYALTGASLHGYSSDEWWDSLVASLGYERAHKFFNALADSLEIGPGTLPQCGRGPLRFFR